ncbi:MAG: MBL fold metallo-hydrolase [Proteobacteria bacterium]|nr:MBL fold metallo-hydrolase [Pseudomonadota bacterium]
MLKWKIGDTTITQVIETTDDAITDMIPFLPDATPERLASIPWLRPNFLSPAGKLVLNIQMLIIETPERRIVVDTCVGNDKTLALDAWANLQLPFLARLNAAGYARESIDTVVCTHLHVDHVGWNTMRSQDRWVPTFPNARYVLVEREFQHWQGIEDDFGPIFAESVRPVFDAGLVDLVADDHEVGSGVWFESTPGHTPGHVSVHIASQGGARHHHRRHAASPLSDCAAGLGHAVRFRQVPPPSPRAVPSRALCDQPVPILGTHFADPVGGHIVRDGTTYRFAV